MTAQTSAQTDPTGPARSTIDETLRAILRDVLGLSSERAAQLTPDSGLEIIIEDDEIDGDHLETYGGLLALAEAKTATR